ncbi:MAG: glucosamine-6-phosphate deaminase [Bacteroidetes bacterium]|nr:glucosamine-6-phosphate deaminase [Bacteroidota bacterium]
MIWSGSFEQVFVEVHENRKFMGKAAAERAADIINKVILKKGSVNIIFAAAPSQNEFLESLTKNSEIQWEFVNGFHMDEYLGLPSNAPQGFGNFLRDRLFDKVPFGSVHYIDSQANNPEEECRRYNGLLQEYPVDLVCMGIGENGHLAFNDPHSAKFDDSESVKIVTLDFACRRQQVNDGCFSTLSDVPDLAITLTIPALTAAEKLLCVVPGLLKAPAVKTALLEPVQISCPASIIRRHPSANLYLDAESGHFLG